MGKKYLAKIFYNERGKTGKDLEHGNDSIIKVDLKMNSFIMLYN